MAYDAAKARVLQQALADGLSDDDALAAAGISPDDAFFYVRNEVGTPASNPSFGQIEPAGFAGIQSPAPESVDVVDQPVPEDDETPARFVDLEVEDTGPVAAQPAFSTVSSSSTVTEDVSETGGGSTVRRVTPTTYRDTDTSRALTTEADDLDAQKRARSAEIKAQGGTGADVLRDPEYRRLADAASEKRSEAQDAKEVDQAGQISVTRTPGIGEETTAQTVDQEYLTTQTAGEDEQVELQQAIRDPGSDSLLAITEPQTVTDLDAPAAGFVFNEDGEQVSADSEEGREILAQERRIENAAAAPVTRNLQAEFDFDNDSWGVWDNDQGRFVETGLTEQEAILAAENGSLEDIPTEEPAPTEVLEEPTTIDRTYSAAIDENGDWGVWSDSEGRFVEEGLSQQEAELRAEEYNTVGFDDPAAIENQSQRLSDQDIAAANEAAIKEKARVQAILANQIRQADSGDWRLKIRLAPGARYLYRGDDGQGIQSGILAPLAVTDGVVFPYTPQIGTSYVARYSEQDLPHSNYRGYFYSNSHVETVNITATFTAQDTAEANYLLAVIHFFRSVTKMFYGQDDTFRGAPPPLVFLQGFGAYQFARHPCVISRFGYDLPSDVDYIRADVQPISGLNIQQGRRPGGVPPQDVPTNVFTAAMGRLAAAGVPKGAVYRPEAAETLGTIQPTYVPTKMQITLDLLPMQTRQQVSQEFNMRDFATGALLKKGFW